MGGMTSSTDERSLAAVVAPVPVARRRPHRVRVDARRAPVLGVILLAMLSANFAHVVQPVAPALFNLVPVVQRQRVGGNSRARCPAQPRRTDCRTATPPGGGPRFRARRRACA